MQAKYGRYGARTRLTDKQYRALHETLDRLLPDPPAPRSIPQRLAETPPWQKQTRPTYPYQQPRPRPWRAPRPFRTPRLLQTPRLLRGPRRPLPRLTSVWLVVLAVFAAILFGQMIESGGGREQTPMAGGSAPQGTGQTFTGSRISVIDGDTVRVAGLGSNVRLVGFNAPETGRPQCGQEQVLASGPQRVFAN